MKKSKKNEALSFYQRQIQNIAYDEQKEFSTFSAHPDEPLGKSTKHPLFWEDDHGNLCIGVDDLYSNQLITYDAKEKTNSRIQIKPFHLKRLKTPKGDAKYLPCIKGMGTFLYFPKMMINAFHKKKEIDTLVITEGYKKAYFAAKHGIPIIGAPGIHMLGEFNPNSTTGRKELRKQLTDIIETCKVQKLVFLTDADTLEVKWKQGKDLYNRPFSFYSAIRAFKDLTISLKIDAYFYHIKESFLNEAKGLDDLLLSRKRHKGEIKKELLHITKEPNYFKWINISTTSYNNLKEYFHILNYKSADEFYEQYQSVIGSRKFIYSGKEFQYNEEENKVEQLRSEFASQFIQIGDHFYKQGFRPTRNGTNHERCLLPVKEKAILKQLNYDKKQFALFLRQVEYYDGAICDPQHLDFKYNITTYFNNGQNLKWYNKYYPLSWNIDTPGEIPTSLFMVKHIFGEEDVDYKGKIIKSYELGLDYIQLLFLKPKQKLPILSLVSRQTKTGKTTFWDWMRSIFQQNCKSIHGDELLGQFTSYFAGSLLVIIEEAMIQKMTISEKIKELVTSKEMKYEAKGQNAEQIDNFIKVGISSNRESDFALIDKEDSRYWVRIVNKIKKEDVHFLDKLVAEIPFFLNFLTKRTMVTEQDSRLWFKPETIRTEALNRVIDQSKPTIIQDIIEALRDYFSISKEVIWQISSSDLFKMIENGRHTRAAMKKGLEIHMNKTTPKSSRSYKYKYLTSKGELGVEIKKTRPYTFSILDAYSLEDVFSILEIAQIIELEAINNEQEIKLFNDKSIEYIKTIEKVDTNKLKECTSFKEVFIKLGWYNPAENPDSEQSGLPFG